MLENVLLLEHNQHGYSMANVIMLISAFLKMVVWIGGLEVFRDGLPFTLYKPEVLIQIRFPAIHHVREPDSFASAAGAKDQTLWRLSTLQNLIHSKSKPDIEMVVAQKCSKHGAQNGTLANETKDQNLRNPRPGILETHQNKN